MIRAERPGAETHRPYPRPEFEAEKCLMTGAGQNLLLINKLRLL